MGKYIFGEIEGIKEGHTFRDRAALREAWIHRTLVAGNDGNPDEGYSSIVLNGGYVDDQDFGDEIIYTGHGGNDTSTKKQIQNQDWDATGNKALIVSELKGIPVRVTRGFKHKSAFSPQIGYQFAGIFYVKDHWEDIGKDGYRICRYRLVKADASENTQEKEEKAGFELPIGKDETKRTISTTIRIVRDTVVSRSIKELYNFICQVCGTRISIRGVPYAEGAHLKPLGRPHNGLDKTDNLLCLCPNHHVMLDKGAFTIANNLSLIGIKGRISVHEKHVINPDCIAYHREHIFIND